MLMDKQLLKRLNHTVEHHLWVSDDGYGDRTYDPTSTTRACYREGKISIVKTIEGTEVTSTLKLYFDGIFPITGKDKMILGGELYPVLSYQQFDGLAPGTGTTVVFL